MKIISKKSFLKVSKLDIINLPYDKVNENGFLVFIDKSGIFSPIFDKIFIKTILKCFGNSYKILCFEEIEAKYENEFNLGIYIKIITNLPFTEYENFDKNYFQNLNNQRPIVVNNFDILNIADSVSLGFKETDFVSFSFEANYKHICLSLLTPILKCFGNSYEIKKISEPFMNGIKIFILVETNLEAKYYYEIENMLKNKN